MKTVGALTVTKEGDRELALTRIFGAPREKLFDAWTQPELIKQWLAPRGTVLAVCDIDLRVGGAYRYVWHGPNGERMGMRGVYREIVRPERIVNTETFDESWYPGSAVGTAVLTERAGRTTLTTTVRYESREARQAVLESPMEQGLGAGYDKLAELLASTEAQAVR